MSVMSSNGGKRETAMAYSSTEQLTAQGYKGSSKAMYRYLERLRTPQRHAVGMTPSKPHRRKSVQASPAPLENFSAQRATWLFVRHPDELDETQQP